MWTRALALVVLAACGQNDPAPAPAAPAPEAPAAPAPAPAPPPPDIAEQIGSAIDADADPCDDFYAYACGKWAANTKIPEDKSSFTRSFTTIHDRNRETLKTLLEEAASDPGDDADAKRLGDFYGACMDQAAIDAAGTTPIDADLARVAALTDKAGLVPVLAQMQRDGLGGLWGQWVDADSKNPDTYVMHVMQGGLGLPDRDYYLADDADMAEIRTKYEAHVARMHVLAGVDEADAAARAKVVVAFEKRLAKHHWPRVELRDADKTYNKLDREGLAKAMPGLDLDAYFAALGAEDVTDIVVMTPPFFEGLNTILADAPLDTLKAYLAWNVINRASPYLTAELEQADFDFYGTTLRGQQEQEARWKRCVQATDRALGELLAQQYIDVAFAGDSKKIALDMIQRIEKAFEEGLPELDWMDDATRAKAVEKARAITNKIGYPDKWRTYEGLTVAADAYAANMRASRQHEVDRDLGRVGDPVDKAEWYMTPPTVNAYYNPTANEIVFPAGILQQPFFDAGYPKAFNFGGIGMVMGHEITHGFDDEGRKYSPTGHLQEWWAPEVAERFEERAACVEELYNGFEIEPGLNVNGKLTLGENIADFGGIKTAYVAYTAWAAEHGPEPEVAGLSPEQQLFVGYAQGWCTLRRPEIARQYAKTDPHSPPDHRVNGPLMNFPAFAKAFSCEPGDAMVREDICEVW